MGLIIETPGFIPYYTGLQNLKLLAGLNSKASPERLRECMTAVGLPSERDRRVAKYSLDMCQRLGIAQAIMESSEQLIPGEPMTGLDNRALAYRHNLFAPFVLTLARAYLSH